MDEANYSSLIQETNEETEYSSSGPIQENS